MTAYFLETIAEVRSIMSLHRSCIEDVFDVIREIQHLSTERKLGQKIANLRKKAVLSVATRELERNRFSNFDSAKKSIQDACSRRLKPSVRKIGEFDVAVEQWLSGNPEMLRSILLAKTENIKQRDEFESFLRKTVSEFFTPIAVDINGPIETQRTKVETYRILRDTALAREIKGTYKCKCQICYQTLMISEDTAYAEAHHIKPLGTPHSGPDEKGNIICVCPNCHVLLDYGTIKLEPNQLITESSHEISVEYIDYHNENIFSKIGLKG